MAMNPVLFVPKYSDEPGIACAWTYLRALVD